ncbi:hypothetical protein [Yersinia phage PY100]|nr:hypothetical protein [Yersinia phage PY100]
MTTPIRRRVSVDTEIKDKVASVDVLNRLALVHPVNAMPDNKRFILLTNDNYRENLKAEGLETPLKFFQTHFSQEGGSPADAYIIFQQVNEAGGEKVSDAVDRAIELGAQSYMYAYSETYSAKEEEQAKILAAQKELAQYVEAHEQKIQCILLTHDPDALGTETEEVTVNDIGSLCRGLNLNRTTVIYHPTGIHKGWDYTGERPDAAITGRMLYKDAGAEQWDYKELTGVHDSNLEAGEQEILISKGYNFVETFTGTTFTHLFRGRTCTDREIRIQWGADWFDNNLQASIMNFMFNNTAGLAAFDYPTFAAVEAIIREWGDRAMNRRIILDFEVTLPDPMSFTAAERKSGKAVINNAYFATLNSAIDGWVVRGKWTIGGI